MSNTPLSLSAARALTQKMSTDELLRRNASLRSFIPLVQNPEELLTMLTAVGIELIKRSRLPA
jgi:hypothetical protein